MCICMGGASYSSSHDNASATAGLHRRFMLTPSSSRKGRWSRLLRRSGNGHEGACRRGCASMLWQEWLMALDYFCVSTKCFVNVSIATWRDLRGSQMRPECLSSLSLLTQSEWATGLLLWGPDPWCARAVWKLLGPACPHPETSPTWPDEPGGSPSHAVLKLLGPSRRMPCQWSLQWRGKV